MAPPLDIGNMCARAQMLDETHPSSPDDVIKGVMSMAEIYEGAVESLAKLSVAKEQKCEQHLEEMRREKEENQAAMRSKEEEMRREREEMRRQREENLAALRRQEEEIKALRSKVEMDEVTIKVNKASINVKDELLVQTAAALKESDMTRAAAFAMRGLKASQERMKNELDKIKEEMRKVNSALRKKDKQLQRTLKELYGFKVLREGVDRMALSLRGRNP